MRHTKKHSRSKKRRKQPHQQLLEGKEEVVIGEHSREEGQVQASFVNHNFKAKSIV